MRAMQARYPDDKFDITMRRAESQPQWRVKCLDCPGQVSDNCFLSARLVLNPFQLYTPGPNETLSNFEVHLKNRQHRHRVNERVNGTAAGGGIGGGVGTVPPWLKRDPF